jgi:hypothetical protein
MKAQLASLLLLAPFASPAQGEDLPPPPLPDDELKGSERSPSPGEARAAPSAYVPRFHTRDSWFLGFGLGSGNGAVYGGNTYATMGDLTGPDPIIVALRFEVGMTLTDRVLLGFELVGLGTQQKVAGERERVLFTNADAIVTFFPESDGLFLRAGGGGSILHEVAEGATLNYQGFNGLFGLGYAFWVGERFNLSLRFDHSRQYYRAGSHWETSGFWAGTVGFDWF